MSTNERISMLRQGIKQGLISKDKARTIALCHGCNLDGSRAGMDSVVSALKEARGWKRTLRKQKIRDTASLFLTID